MAVYRLRVRGHTGLIPRWSFGMHIQAVTGQAGVISDAAVDAFTAMWDGVPAGTNALKTLYDVDTVADDVIVDELDDLAQHNVEQAVAPIARAGTGAGDPLPPNVAVVCSQITTLPTRRGRGRSALPPPTEDNSDTGRLIDASRVIFAEAYNNFLEHLNALGFVVVVLHRESSPDTVHPTPAGPPSPVIGVRVGNVFDTQRRRRRKLVEVYTQLATG